VFWKVWCWCLLKANHRPARFPFNNHDYLLNKGDFITGRAAACAELRITPRQYRTAIKYLKATSRVTIKTTNKFTVVSIVNWEKYQKNNMRDQQNDQQTTSQRPTNDQPATTNKNNKKEENNKKERISNELLSEFELARKAYPGDKRGRDTELNDFRKKHADYKEIISVLYDLIELQKDRRAELAKKKEFVPAWKHFKTYLNTRSWESEIG